METEAELSESIQIRRRSASFSDDYSVQRTNDDASQSKLAAVQLNYYKDDFLRKFVSGSLEEGHVLHRDPEISIGYWARVSLIRKFVEDFLAHAGNEAQVISLGAGFDTLYWRLKAAGAKFARYVEVDFSTVTAKKIRLIRKPGSAELVQAFSQAVTESQHADLHAGDYHLVGADLRQWEELRGKLRAAGVDFEAPTLILAECVIVYMSVGKSEELLANLASTFDTVALLSYEQVNTTDEFSAVMIANLEKRGLMLPGLAAGESIQMQRDRLTKSGFTHGIVTDMHSAYGTLLPEAERRRVEAIEMLDEKELLKQLNEHYSISYVSKGAPDGWGQPAL